MSYRIHCEHCDKSVPAAGRPDMTGNADTATWFAIADMFGPGVPDSLSRDGFAMNQPKEMRGLHFCSLRCASEWFAAEANAFLPKDLTR